MAASGGDRLLDVRGLSVAYGKVEAVRNLSLKVERGTIVSVIGPNGAGKTTLLAALMGLLPAKGDVAYLGVPAGALTVEERVARGLILVPERRELFAAMSVADNLELGGFQRAMARRARLARHAERTSTSGFRASPSEGSSSPARSRAASGRCSRWAER